MCHDARVEVRGQFTVVWIFFPPCGTWELKSQVTKFDKCRYSLSHFTGPWFHFFETKSLYLVQADLKFTIQHRLVLNSLNFLNFIQCIYLCACFYACLSVYAHWCTLVHACIYYCLCGGQRSEFSSSTKLVLEVYQAWQQVSLPTSLLLANIDRYSAPYLCFSNFILILSCVCMCHEMW